LEERQRSSKTSTGDKTILKQVLRDECLPTLCKQWKYYSTETVATWLNSLKLRCPPATLNRYLHEFKRAGVIYDAGRGWYSRLAAPFTLNREPVASQVQELNKTFPLVEFSCWSTEQIKGAMHHLLSRFVTFVNVETDAMKNVWEHLRDAGWDAWLNPRGARAARARQKNPSPIEKLLVDLLFEVRDLQLMAMPEFHTLVANLAGMQRIQVATLLKYASERKLSPSLLFGELNQLTPPF